jgi:hypothetical protein
MNPAQERAAGTKNTVLFDIVNRKETPVGMGVEPMGERVSVGAKAFGRSDRFGETNPSC